MERGYTIGLGSYIDGTIDDTALREIDWNIAIYTLTDNLPRVIENKWRRLVYLQTGSLQSTRSMLRQGYKKEVIQ